MTVALEHIVGQALRGAVWCNAARECELSDDECRRFGCRRFADRETILARIEQQGWSGEAATALRSDEGKRMLDEAISARLAKLPNEPVQATAALAAGRVEPLVGPENSDA
jgi:hypothetical protein